MAKKSKNKKWFIPVRGSYLPNSWQGWLTYIPFTIFLVAVALVGWNYSENHTVAVLYIIPNWIAAVVVMTWLAKRTS
jgi:branched-subunit amino acid transport protein